MSTPEDPAPFQGIDPNLPMPVVGGCYVRNEDGSLQPDPAEPPAPAPAPSPDPQP